MKEIDATVECPSGLVVSIREAETRDIKLLSKGSRNQNVDSVSDFLGAITVKVEDPGPYICPSQQVISTDGKVNWSNALQGDSSFMFLRARALTFGEDVFFKVVCANRLCQKSLPDQHIELGSIVNHGLSKMAQKAVEENGTDHLFETMLPRAEVKAYWKLLTRKDQFRVDLQSENDIDEIGTVSILSRMPRVEGCTSPGELQRFANRLKLTDSEHLRALYEEHDIRLEDRVEIICSRCGKIFEVPIPTGRDFFSKRSATPPRNGSSKRSTTSHTFLYSAEGTDTVEAKS